MFPKHPAQAAAETGAKQPVRPALDRGACGGEVGDMNDLDTLARLAATIRARRGADPDTSWTARLLARGPEKCAEKFGEEAVEAIIEAVKGDRVRLAAEAADVLYHLLVMLTARDVALEDVLAELARREGTSGIAEKAGRKGQG